MPLQANNGNVRGLMRYLVNRFLITLREICKLSVNFSLFSDSSKNVSQKFKIHALSV